ncbi:MAG: T9SS type A sorting domain-containing protein [Bacteroidetes bacterium]|nr:T9SS type A sorting domain-containing protein [Bacteroidota bacterium]
MKKIILIFCFFCLGFKFCLNAQTASTDCANSPTLSTATYTNLSTTNNVSWYTFIANSTVEQFTLVSNSNNSLYKIYKVEVYTQPCNTGILLAKDSLTDLSDSILTISLNQLNPANKLRIKIYRESINHEPSFFSITFKAPEFCGFSWSISPPNLISYNPLNYTYYYDYYHACLKDNVTGAPINTSLWPNSFDCIANITTGCSNTSESFGVIYISYSPVSSGNPGTWLPGNVPIVIFSNVAGTTYTTQITPTGTLALSLNIIGATTYTISTLINCDPSSITPNSSPEDVEFCSCNKLIVNVQPFQCNINVPAPLCANQPFCFGTTNQIPYSSDYTLAGGLNIVQAVPVGGGIPINASTITASSNNICFNSGLPAGTYNLINNSSLVYFHNTNSSLNYTCVCTNTVLININNPPTGPTTIIANPTNICITESATLTANSTGANNYIWQPGGVNSLSIIVTPTSSTTYSVMAYAGTCPGPTAQITIEPQNCCKFPKNNGLYFNNVTLVPPFTFGATPWALLTSGGTYNSISISVPTGSNINNAKIAVTGSLIINVNNLTFNNGNFIFTEAAQINQNGSNTTLNKCYLRACEKNWKGIITTNVLNITNSVIEDAQYAVFVPANTIAHPGLLVNNTLFNKNLSAVFVLSRNFNAYNFSGNIVTSRQLSNTLYDFTSTTPWQYMSGLTTLDLSTTPTAFLLGSTVLGISNTIRGQYGVLLVNANDLTTSNGVSVGNTHASPVIKANRRCVYDNLRFGVYALGSKLAVINSHIQNIYGDGSNPATASAYLEKSKAVFGYSGSGPVPARYTNTVHVCTNGVLATNQSSFTVANNSFNYVTNYANHIYNINYASSFIYNNTISDNNFTQCNYDLYAFDNRRINLSFQNNTSTFTLPTIKPKANYYVYVNEINKPAAAYYEIKLNSPLNGKQNGFSFLNVYGAKVVDNDVNIIPPPPSAFNANIALQNTDYSEFLNNNLNVVPNALSSFNNYGILTDISANNLFCGNNIINSGTSLKFQGPSPSRVYNNSLNNNPGNPCQFGIWLDQFANIGPITFTTALGNLTANNEFGDFSFADTYSQFSSIGSTIDYQGAASAGNIYYPNVNLISSPASSCTPNPNSSVGFPICNSTFLAFIQNLSAGVPPFLNGLLNFGANTTNANAMARKSIFELFKKGSFNTASLSNYNSFMSANASANTGKFYTIDSLIYNYALTTNSLNLAQMLSQNTSAIATNTVEQNQINFNAIYYSYLTNPASITPAQFTSLQNIAQMCPFTNGTSVYQARAVLRYFNDSTYYTNPCEFNLPSVAGSGSRLGSVLNEKDKEVENMVTKTQLYPNPANTEIEIKTTLNNATIEIYNILGQLILKSKLTNDTKLNVTELKTGTYFYNILSNGIKVEADKLIINH